MSTRYVRPSIMCFLTEGCFGFLERITIESVGYDNNNITEKPIYQCIGCGREYWNSDFKKEEKK